MEFAANRAFHVLFIFKIFGRGNWSIRLTRVFARAYTFSTTPKLAKKLAHETQRIILISSPNRTMTMVDPQNSINTASKAKLLIIDV